MMAGLKGTSCLIVVIMLAGVACGRPIGVSLKFGTLGPGGDVTVNLGKKANLRGGINLFGYKRTVDLDEARVDGDIDLHTIPVLLDWHPAGSGFRLSGGVIFNENKISLTASPNETLSFQGADYTVESLDGEVSFNEISPYIGIGYGDAVGGNGRWRFACDFGLMYHDKPDVFVEATARNPFIQAQLDRDLQAEKEEFEEDIENFVVYPVVSVGFSFAF